MSQYTLQSIASIGSLLGGLGAAVAAFMSVKSASLAKKSIDQQQEMMSASTNPVLGFKQILAFGSDNGTYPVHLFFTNHGQGAGWILKVECMRSDGQFVEAHVSNPVCIGPGETSGGITVFLTEKEKPQKLELALYYWDIQNCAHRTTLNTDITWKSTINPIPDMQVFSEQIDHKLDIPRPTVIEHQSSSPI